MDDIVLLLLWVAAVCGALVMASLVADMIGMVRKYRPRKRVPFFLRKQATYRRK